MSMMTDLTAAKHKKKQQMLSPNKGGRRKRRRLWPPLVGALAFLWLLASSSASDQQQPSQLFLPATSQKGPISLVPRVNQKRLEEEVDGFIMQAQQNSSSSSNPTPSASSKPDLNKNNIAKPNPDPNANLNASLSASGDSSGSSEQAAALTFETTTTTQASAGANRDQAAEDEYRIPIDVNRQQFVTHDQLTNASTDTDSMMSSESKVFESSVASGEEGETTTTTTTTTTTSAPNGDHRGQHQWSLVSHLSSLLSGAAAAAAAVSGALGGDNNGRQSAGDGAGAGSLSSLYFLSSANGSDTDAGRHLVENSNGASAEAGTTTTGAPASSSNLAQPAAGDRAQQQAATKRVAGQSQPFDQTLSDADAEDAEPKQTARCSGYCTIPLFSMLCDFTYESQDCSQSGQKCCAHSYEKAAESTTSAAATDNTDQLQQEQFIEQASRPQSASQVCRGACLPMYHSSLCMKPNEIQLDSPGCLPSFVCCSSPAGRQAAGEAGESNRLDEPVAASPSDHTISHTSYPQEQPPPGDGSLAAALVPLPPPPMSSSSPSLAAAPELHHQDPSQPPGDSQQISRQPLYSLRPTLRPSLQAATTKSSSSSSPSLGFSSPAASFISQLYQIFKSTASSGAGNNSRDKQQPRHQRQPPVSLPAQPVQQPIASSSFLSHLFADPYQALYGSSPRPPSSAPPSANHFGPFVVEPAAQVQLQHPQMHLLPASKGRHPHLVDPKPMVNMMSYPNSQQQYDSAKYKGNQHQQIIMSANENNQQVVPQQAASDQEQLLYLQHQLYLQKQQQQQQQQLFNKQNGFSSVPNQRQFQQQRFQYPVLTATDNAHPTTYLLANQKASQLTSPLLAGSAKGTGQMKVVQQSQAVTHYPFHLTAVTVAAPVTINRQQQHLNKPEQMSALYPTARPVDGAAQQQVRIQSRQPPLEQKGFVGLPLQQQPIGHHQVPSAKVPQHQQQKTVLPQQQYNYKPNINVPSPDAADQSSPPAPTRSATGSAGIRTQAPTRVSGSTELSRATANNVGHKSGSNRLPMQSGGEADSPHVNRSPSMSSLSSNVNVLISNGPHLDQHRDTGDMQHVQSQQNNLHNGHKISPSQNQRRPSAALKPIHEESDGSIIIPNDDSDILECPSACLANSIATLGCIKPNYLDENYACLMSGSVCCIQVDTPIPADPDNKQQHHRPSGSYDSNKLDYSPGAQMGTSDDQMSSPADLQTDLITKVSTEATSDEVSTSSSYIATTKSPQKDSQQTKVLTCGVPNSSVGRQSSGLAKGRVMGGFDAKPGYWCWQAALMNEKNEYLCGGALIGAKWVLTAAHCITQHLRDPASPLHVRLGQHNLNSNSSGKGARSIPVKTSYVHHNHNGMTLDNDVALVRLEEPVDLDDGNPDICLICLPERNSHLEVGKRCLVTGYGFENETGTAALRVRQTELPIVADQECVNNTASALKKPFALPASSFCAGGEQGQDACHGDGGSPLSCQVDGYYELTGIVSWGYKCGQRDLPGLYSKVSAFVGWINQIVSVNN